MRTRRRLFRVWHRRVGLISSVFLLWIAVTGLVLNHTDDLGLNGPSRWGGLAEWLGISVGCDARAWPVSGRVIVVCENGLYWDDRRVTEISTVHAVAELAPWVVVHNPDGIWVFDDRGRVVDQLTAPAPLALDALRIGPTGVFVQSGLGLWRLDPELLEWQALDSDQPALERPVAMDLDEQSIARASRRASGYALSWTKLLQELHSGRVLKPLGPLMLDLSALALILLAILGIVIDVRRSPPPKTH